MIIILFKILTNTPVILRGETGCGKTALVKKLMELFNNGDPNYLITKTMHSGVSEKDIEKLIQKAEDKANKDKGKNVCVFLDEINTTSYISLMKELFVNHTLKGERINEKIIFIGACNPFRKKDNTELENGLKLEKKDKGGAAYLVNPLSYSLLYYIFDFASLSNEDVKKYIESIVGDVFIKDEDKKLKELAIDCIFESHKYVRKVNGKSSVSLRDLKRFEMSYKFFNDYYKYKNESSTEDQKETDKTKIEYQSKIKSIILSLFITYYIKLFKSGNIVEYD